jgi:hypothetical protein
MGGSRFIGPYIRTESAVAVVDNGFYVMNSEQGYNGPLTG